MLNELKKAYSLLSDDLSRQIFINRLGFMSATQIGSEYTEEGMNCFSRMLKLANLDVSDLKKKIGDNPVIVYGIGYCSYLFTAFFKAYFPNKEITAYCDRRNNEVSQFFGKKVLSITQINEMFPNAVIIITPNYVKDEIVSELRQNGVSNDRIVFDYNKLITTFSDEYFDGVLNFSENEVFVDAGCCNCANSLDFIKRCPSYEKIYAFEPDSNSYMMCKQVIRDKAISNIELHDCGLWDKKDTATFGGNGCPHIDSNGEQTIKLDTLDAIVNGAKVTFIKMDIEGAELNALHGAKNTIVSNKPKLAICIYHKPDDIWELPLYIHELVPEYKMYIRHYSAKACSTILYATIE